MVSRGSFVSCAVVENLPTHNVHEFYKSTDLSIKNDPRHKIVPPARIARNDQSLCKNYNGSTAAQQALVFLNLKKVML